MKTKQPKKSKFVREYERVVRESQRIVKARATQSYSPAFIAQFRRV